MSLSESMVARTSRLRCPVWRWKGLREDRRGNCAVLGRRLEIGCSTEEPFYLLQGSLDGMYIVCRNMYHHCRTGRAWTTAACKNRVCVLWHILCTQSNLTPINRLHKLDRIRGFGSFDRVVETEGSHRLIIETDGVITTSNVEWEELHYVPMIQA